MRRFLTSALILGAISGFGLVGCADENKSKVTETTSDSGGTTTKSTEVKVQSRGDNPPPDSAGETGKTPK